jgi:hypothetical protein
MVDYQQLVSEMRDKHCGACAVGLSVKAMEELARNEITQAPVKAEQTLPKPVKAAKVHKQARMVVKGRTEKACNACHTIKPVSAYPLNKKCADGHTGTCAACTKERMRRNYQAAQARKRGNTVLDRVEADTKKLHDNRCFVCHCNFESQAKLTEHNKQRHGD